MSVVPISIVTRLRNAERRTGPSVRALIRPTVVFIPAGWTGSNRRARPAAVLGRGVVAAAAASSIELKSIA
jgi:hypothetical protein